MPLMNIPITTNRRKLEFDKKIKQIQSDELKLKTLEQELLSLQLRVASEASPLVREFCELRVESLNRLKQHRTDDFFKKKEKRQIINLMLDLSLGLQDMGDERADNFLAEIYSEVKGEAKGEFKGSSAKSDNQPYKAKPTLEDQLEGKVEIKMLYRELAKAFHPDKEPLEHLKEEKTSLMKKITEAYENQDLYGLLKLEKEYMKSREFSEDKIDLYIKHINDRLKELKVFEASLKKHGPLSTVYKYIYSRKATIQEDNIINELAKIEQELRKEKALQQMIWDSGSLRHYFQS